MPEGVLRKAMQVMPHVRLMHGYGMTEASPIVTLLDPRYTTLDGPYAGRLKSCGQAALTCEVKVVDRRAARRCRAAPRANWRSAAPTS